MPFERPTLTELVERVRSDFKSRLEIAGAILRRAMVRVVAAVFAGAVHALHGHLLWLSRQLFGDTAEESFLVRWASMYGITKTPATFAEGTVTATGDNGEVVPQNAILVRDDGVTYEVTEESDPIAGGETTVSVRAVEAGADGNLDADETLDFESPIAGVDSEVTVDGPDGIEGGNDEEGKEALRDRYLLRLREPPAGGAAQDYEAWALAVAGVTRAWVYENENGLGTVVVRFVRDDDVDGGGEPDIIPSAGEVQDVQDALDVERPITVEVTAEAPVALEVDFTIAITPDDTTTRAAVEAELEDMLFREAEPGDGAGRGTILLSQIQVAVGVAAGVEDFDVTSPAADVEPDTGEIAVMGDITWA